MLNTQLGELLALSPSTISRIRSGQREPTLENMRQVEQVFGWAVGAQDHALRSGYWLKSLEYEIARYDQLDQAAT